MQAAIQAKMPVNQTFFGSLCKYLGYVDCIKDNVQIDPCMCSGLPPGNARRDLHEK